MKRLTTTEVCQLGRFSRATLWRRVKSGALPQPVDHAREALFCASAVEQALTRHGLDHPAPQPHQNVVRAARPPAQNWSWLPPTDQG